MCYIRKINTNQGTRFYLTRSDRTKIGGTGYYRTQLDAWKIAKKLKLKILNYKRRYNKN